MSIRTKTLLIISVPIISLIAVLYLTAMTSFARGDHQLVLLVALGLAGLGCILITWLLLEKAILAPLAKMSTALRVIGSTGEFEERLPVSGKDELAGLAGSINRILLETLEQRSHDLDRRLLQIRTAAEIAQITTSGGTGQPAAKGVPAAGPGLNALLNHVIHLIVERLGYANTAIYLLDHAREHAVLVATTGEGNNRFKVNTFKVVVGSRSMVGWVTANNRPRVAAEVSQDPYYLKDEFLPGIRSEVVIPISVGEVVLGALDIQSDQPNHFQPGDLSILETLSNQLATAIHNIRLLEATQINLEEASLLYQASRNITQAEDGEEILRVVDRALHQTSYLTMVYSVHGSGLRKVVQTTPQGARLEAISERLPVTAEDLENLFSKDHSDWAGSPYLVIDSPTTSTLPYPLLHLLRQWQCETAALLPVMCENHLAALFVLGARQKDCFNPATLQPYASLAEVTATALQKVQALQATEKSLAELRTLNAVSQAISIQTDLDALYQVIHHAVIQVMGNVYFLIALYDPAKNMIQIPYMWEKDGFLNVEPFPLGEGLTSIIIRTRNPLMLVVDTERQAKEMGAITVGQPAKSWLGVPMMVGGDVIGAIVVQDTEHEHRFSEEDKRLLTTLAAQVAAAIRNAHILESTRLQARRERLLHEVTSKIRSSVDMNTILATATSELGKALNARRTHIKLGIPGGEDAPNATGATLDPLGDR
jgi:GAF domain-containing protein